MMTGTRILYDVGGGIVATHPDWPDVAAEAYDQTGIDALQAAGVPIVIAPGLSARDKKILRSLERAGYRLKLAFMSGRETPHRRTIAGRSDRMAITHGLRSPNENARERGRRINLPFERLI